LGNQAQEIHNIQQGADREGNGAMVKHYDAFFDLDLVHTVQTYAVAVVPNVHDGCPANSAGTFPVWIDLVLMCMSLAPYRDFKNLDPGNNERGAWQTLARAERCGDQDQDQDQD